MFRSVKQFEYYIQYRDVTRVERMRGDWGHRGQLSEGSLHGDKVSRVELADSHSNFLMQNPQGNPVKDFPESFVHCYSRLTSILL